MFLGGTWGLFSPGQMGGQLFLYFWIEEEQPSGFFFFMPTLFFSTPLLCILTFCCFVPTFPSLKEGAFSSSHRGLRPGHPPIKTNPPHGDGLREKFTFCNFFFCGAGPPSRYFPPTNPFSSRAQ